MFTQHSNGHWMQKMYAAALLLPCIHPWLTVCRFIQKQPGRAVCVLDESSCPPLDLIHCVDEYPLYYDPIYYPCYAVCCFDTPKNFCHTIPLVCAVRNFRDMFSMMVLPSMFAIKIALPLLPCKYLRVRRTLIVLFSNTFLSHSPFRSTWDGTRAVTNSHVGFSTPSKSMKTTYLFLLLELCSLPLEWRVYCLRVD